MHSLSPGSNYIIHTITYILLFLGQIICSRNSCHSRKYLVISALVIGSREIIPEHFEHVTHAQAWTAPNYSDKLWDNITFVQTILGFKAFRLERHW